MIGSSAMSFSILFAVMCFIEGGIDSHPREMPACGPASIFHMLYLHDIDTSITDIESTVFTVNANADLEALSMAELRSVLKKYGLQTQSVEVESRKLDLLPTPAILYLEPQEQKDVSALGHFVVIEGIDNDQVTFVDLTFPVNESSQSRFTTSVRKLELIWNGKAIIGTEKGNMWMLYLSLLAFAGLSMLFAQQLSVFFHDPAPRAESTMNAT